LRIIFILKGDNIALVIGQLLGMHNRLHPSDWDHLRSASFLPAKMKNSSEGSIVKSTEPAHELLFADPYLLLSIFVILCKILTLFSHGVLLELGFKVLDWEGASKLQKNFLKDIGIKTHPDLKMLLNVAATTTSREICFKAIAYQFSFSFSFFLSFLFLFFFFFFFLNLQDICWTILIFTQKNIHH
jgi:hypothetical protein